MKKWLGVAILISALLFSAEWIWPSYALYIFPPEAPAPLVAATAHFDYSAWQTVSSTHLGVVFKIPLNFGDRIPTDPTEEMVFADQTSSSGGDIILIIRMSDLPKGASLDQAIESHTKSLKSITHINIGGHAFSGWYSPDQKEWTWSYNAADRSSGQIISIATPSSSFEASPDFEQILASLEITGAPSSRGGALISGPPLCATAKTPVSLEYFSPEYDIVPEFTCDKTHVYYKNEIIQGADPDTFAFFTLQGPEPDISVNAGPIGPMYEVDKNAIYYLEDKIGDDPQGATLIIPNSDSMDSPYSFLADSDHVFYEGKQLAGADPATFTILSDDSIDCMSEGYSRDANHIYFNADLMTGAGTSTFKVLINGYATDGQHIYYGETPTDNDPATFTLPPCEESEEG